MKCSLNYGIFSFIVSPVWFYPVLSGFFPVFPQRGKTPFFFGALAACPLARPTGRVWKKCVSIFYASFLCIALRGRYVFLFLWGRRATPVGDDPRPKHPTQGTPPKAPHPTQGQNTTTWGYKMLTSLIVEPPVAQSVE